MIEHRTAQPVPLLWVATALVGVVVGVAAELALGWSWWLVAAGSLVLVWLLFLATAFRHPGRDHLWIDLVATARPRRAQQLEMRRLVRLVEAAPGPVYGLAEWEGPRQIGGYGRSSSQGLTHLELSYGSPGDEPTVGVKTVWKRPHRSDISIDRVRGRLTRELWRRRLHSPAELGAEDDHEWMRRQGVDIDRRPIPDWTTLSVPIDGTAYDAQVYREGEYMVAVTETDLAVIEIRSYQIPVEGLTLAPVDDLTPYGEGRVDSLRSHH